jgi:hypothetical protein
MSGPSGLLRRRRETPLYKPLLETPQESADSSGSRSRYPSSPAQTGRSWSLHVDFSIAGCTPTTIALDQIVVIGGTLDARIGLTRRGTIPCGPRRFRRGCSTGHSWHSLASCLWCMVNSPGGGSGRSSNRETTTGPQCAATTGGALAAEATRSAVLRRGRASMRRSGPLRRLGLCAKRGLSRRRGCRSKRAEISRTTQPPAERDK